MDTAAWVESLLKVDSGASQEAAATAAGLLLKSGLTRKMDLVDFDAADLAPADEGVEHVGAAKALIRRAIRIYTSSSVDKISKENPQQAAAAASGGLPDVKVVALLRAALGCASGAESKEKLKPMKVDEALEQVDLAEDLKEVAWPGQELVEYLHKAKVDSPHVVHYVDFRTRCMPYWCDKCEEEDDEPLDPDADGFQVIARAITGAVKSKDGGKAKSQPHECTWRWNVWTAAFQACRHQSVFCGVWEHLHNVWPWLS